MSVLNCNERTLVLNLAVEIQGLRHFCHYNIAFSWQREHTNLWMQVDRDYNTPFDTIWYILHTTVQLY